MHNKTRASTLPKAATDWMSCVRKKLESQDVTGEPLNMVLASWRHSTQKQYKTYVSALKSMFVSVALS